MTAIPTLDRQFALAGRATFRDYETAYNQAVLFARHMSREVGVEAASEYGKKVFHVKPLPKPENRYGHELRMEVVAPSSPLCFIGV